MYDTIWKVSVLAILIYILYTLFKIQKQIIIQNNKDKNIVLKNLENLNSVDNFLSNNTLETLEEYSEKSIDESLVQSLEDDDNVFEHKKNEFQFSNTFTQQDLKDRNLKDIKNIAKNLNISISNKKKNDIINEILINK